MSKSKDMYTTAHVGGVIFPEVRENMVALALKSPLNTYTREELEAMSDYELDQHIFQLEN